jgi:hypothetical protein
MRFFLFLSGGDWVLAEMPCSAMGGEVFSVDDMPVAEMRQGAVKMATRDGESPPQRPQLFKSQGASSIVSMAYCHKSTHREIAKRGNLELSDGGGEAGLLALMCSGAHLQRF